MKRVCWLIMPHKSTADCRCTHFRSWRCYLLIIRSISILYACTIEADPQFHWLASRFWLRELQGNACQVYHPENPRAFILRLFTQLQYTRWFAGRVTSHKPRVCMYICVYACMYACMYVCVCVYVCMYWCHVGMYYPRQFRAFSCHLIIQDWISST
jgi:hypothetical protein